MSRKSRDKGQRIEREIVQRHLDMGVHAERVPLSGAAGGSYTGDVLIHYRPLPQTHVMDGYIVPTRKGPPLIAEVKARKNGGGFATIEGWLASNDVLFLRRDRADPVVVLPWSTWARLIGPDMGAAA